jgi:hypothetical protein
MDQLDSQLPAADAALDQGLLDRIDEIVPPGINLNPADGGWTNPPCSPPPGVGRGYEPTATPYGLLWPPMMVCGPLPSRLAPRSS